MSQAAVVRTVLGDVSPQALGAVDYHEHLFQATPLLPHDDLDDLTASRAEAGSLQASGVGCVVEATPIGLGRSPKDVARISEALGLHIVHTTGAHREEHYRTSDNPVLKLSEQDLMRRFERELLEAMDEHGCVLTSAGQPVRAGLMKAGVGYWSISAFERNVLTAIAIMGSRTGAPLMVHLEFGSAAHEVLDLIEDAGCGIEQVALAHVDRNPDAGYLAELASRGAYLGFDGPARYKRWPDSVLLDCMAELITRGHADRILLGGDVARRSRYVAYGGMPGLKYLFERFVPRMRATIGQEATHAITHDNPQAWLSWQPSTTALTTTHDTESATSPT